MKIRIHVVDDVLICIPALVYMIAFGLQYGLATYLGGANRVEIPTNREDWGVFIAMSIISLFLMGRSYSIYEICETGVRADCPFGLIKKRYRWEEFLFTGCYLNVDKEKANRNDPNDYVIFLKRRKPRLDYEWYLRIVADCCFPCYPTLYLIMEALTCRFDKPLPFPVDVPPKKSGYGSDVLKKWHFVWLGYMLFCLIAAFLTMWHELDAVLDIFIWGIVIGYGVICLKARNRLQDLNEERCQRFFEYIKESGYSAN